MMKKWTKKVWMSAAAVLIAIMSVSAIPASADVSRVVYFPIQNYVGCNTTSTANAVVMAITISNIQNSNSTFSLHLYNDDGNEVSLIGYPGSTAVKPSDITLSSSNALGPKQTKHFGAAFGQGNNVCSDIPAFGKIVVDSDSGMFIASGELVSSYTLTNPPVINNDSAIVINNGQPF